MEDENFAQNRAGKALKSLNQIDLEPSPFLLNRVHANWRATQQVGVPWWKTRMAISLGASAVALTAVLLVLTKMPTVSSAPQVQMFALGQPYMIRMDVRAINQNEIAYAEVEIEGDGARFASKKFADIKEKRKIVVAGDKLLDKQYLPVVVEGVASGMARVKVSFYNANNEVIAARSLDLNFQKGAI